jgi:flagellin FlaB
MQVKEKIRGLYTLRRAAAEGQSGITGLETAIVLIAFIVVAAVFAFAVLTTGLFSTEKAKQTALAGLEEATNTLEPKGAIIAEESTESADKVANIRFKMTNSAGADSVGLPPSTTLITYSDANNQENALHTGAGPGPSTADRPTSGDSVGWDASWILGTGDNVDPGEIVEITLNVDRVALGANTPFKIEVIPGSGAVITIERTTPLEIKPIMDLD